MRGLCISEKENITPQFYLDDYGIGLLQLSKTADDKYISASRLFQTKLNQAWECVFKDIKFDGYTANKILNNVTVGNINASSSLLGEVEFVLNKCDLTSFFIRKIKACVLTGGTLSIDIIQDGTTTNLYNGTPDDNSVVELLINDYSGNFQIVTSGTATMCGGELTNTSSANYYVDGAFNGLIIDIQVRCNQYNYLCDYLDLLVPAVMYKLSALIWKESMDSNRFNNFLNIKLGDNNDNAVTQLAWLDSEYNLLKYDPNAINKSQLGMYQLELEKINIPTPSCKCCMECTGTNFKYLIP